VDQFRQGIPWLSLQFSGLETALMFAGAIAGVAAGGALMAQKANEKR
jgi:hypothetical protein